MYITNNNYRILLAYFCLLFSVCCSKKVPLPMDSVAVGEKQEISDTIRKELSGIWYTGPSKNIYHPSKVLFSWGEEEFDYEYALCIDLLITNPILRIADRHFSVDHITVADNGKTITMELFWPRGSTAGILSIKRVGDGIISLSRADKEAFSWDSRLIGSYFKLDGPQSD
jgi:hypothetical protein